MTRLLGSNRKRDAASAVRETGASTALVLRFFDKRQHEGSTCLAACLVCWYTFRSSTGGCPHRPHGDKAQRMESKTGNRSKIDGYLEEAPSF